MVVVSLYLKALSEHGNVISLFSQYMINLKWTVQTFRCTSYHRWYLCLSDMNGALETGAFLTIALVFSSVAFHLLFLTGGNGWHEIKLNLEPLLFTVLSPSNTESYCWRTDVTSNEHVCLFGLQLTPWCNRDTYVTRVYKLKRNVNTQTNKWFGYSWATNTAWLLLLYLLKTIVRQL